MVVNAMKQIHVRPWTATAAMNASSVPVRVFPGFDGVWPHEHSGQVTRPSESGVRPSSE
jgi:hypothetical protein